VNTTAKKLDGSTSTGQGIEYICSIADDTVDLITAAMAAHWFDMGLFWERAATLVRPGRSVPIWTMNPECMHRDVPNYEAINELLEGIRRREIGCEGIVCWAWIALDSLTCC